MSIVFVNGSFDILHIGHLKLLEYAKSLGDKLYVALDSDAHIALRKRGRPINELSHRMYMMNLLKPVDRVFSFNNHHELRDLIYEIMPDIMVVGSDWAGKPIIGSEYAKEVIYFERVAGYSSTSIIESIISR